MREWRTVLGDLEAALEIRDDEIELLRSIDKSMLRRDPLADTLGLAVEGVRTMLSADLVVVHLVAGHDARVAVSSPAGRRKADSGWRPLPERVLASRTSGTDGGLAVEIGIVDDASEFEFVTSVPITVATDSHAGVDATHPSVTRLGLLSASWAGARPNVEHREALEAVADQLGIAIDRAQFRDAQQVLQEVDSLLFEAEGLSEQASDRALDRAMGLILAKLTQLEYVDVEAAQLLLAENGHLRLVASTVEEQVGEIVSLASVSGRALHTNTVQHVRDVASEPDYHRLLGSEIVSELAVPVYIGETPIGVVNVESSRQGHFEGSRRVLIERFANKVSFALGFARLRRELAVAVDGARADAAVYAVGESVANMVHRLNNTVGAMRYWTDSLAACLHQEPDVKAIGDAVSGITEAMAKIEELPEQLKTRFTLDEDADLNASVRASLARLVPASVQVNAQGLGKGLPTIASYGLELVLENLINNAVEAMDRDGTITVATEGVIDGRLGRTSHVELHVSDTGVGMDQKTAAEVFTLGFSTKEHGNSGMGFGMWWVRNLVSRADGEIWVDSSPGVGTRVSVRWPSSVLHAPVD